MFLLNFWLLLVNVDKLKETIISTDWEKKTAYLFIWGKNNPFIWNNPQSNFTLKMTNKHLQKVKIILGVAGHA